MKRSENKTSKKLNILEEALSPFQTSKKLQRTPPVVESVNPQVLAYTLPQNTMEEQNEIDKEEDAIKTGDIVIRGSQNSRKVLRSPVQISGQAAARPSSSNDHNATPATSLREKGDQESLNSMGRGIASARSFPVVIFGKNTKTPQSSIETPRSSMETNNVDGPSSAIGGSPRQEFIIKMRLSEEEALERCRKTLRKIRQAMGKQRNISMEVQNGVGELDELIDVIEDCRRSWKNAEREKEVSLKALDCAKGRKEAEDMSTPSVLSNKRSATSPAEVSSVRQIKRRMPEPDHGQPVREDRDENNKKDRKKKRRKKKRRNKERKPKQKPEAVLIKPSSGHTYAEVLTNIKAKVNPEEANVAVRSISKTKSGSILLVMGKGGEKEKFCNAIKSCLKEAAIVEDLKPRATLEIQDLDSLSTAEEIQEKINKVTGILAHDIRIHLTSPNWRDQRRAFISLPVDGANKILETERILIGITNCRVRHREEIKRCFRCFSSGHMQWECKGVNRKDMGLCIRCGEPGHKMKECHNSPKCCICVTEGRSLVDHLPGSRSCNMNNKQIL